MAKLGNVIKISDSDYTALKNAGSAGYVINGTRYYYDENSIYLTPNNGGSGSSADFVEEISWANLKSKRDDSLLIPGKVYRIIDYVTTTAKTNSSSAGNVFDILVVADSANKLNEDARAIQHSGDTYFSNCKLEAWELKYCIDNNTDRFDWADSTNGKGVIYYMKDEWDNELPYDFKNLKFTFTSNGITISNKYTFYNSTQTGSLIGYGDDSKLGFSRGNKIGQYNTAVGMLYLPFNIFRPASKGPAGSTRHSYAQNNIFGDNCYNNIFGPGCINNKLSDNCHDICIGTDSNDNNFGLGCYNIYCATNFIGNTFGNDIFNIECKNSSGDSTSYIKNLTVDNGCSYLRIYSTDGTEPGSSNYLQNIYVCHGYCGSSSSYRGVYTARNKNTETEFYSSSNYTGGKENNDPFIYHTDIIFKLTKVSGSNTSMNGRVSISFDSLRDFEDIWDHYYYDNTRKVALREMLYNCSSYHTWGASGAICDWSTSGGTYPVYSVEATTSYLTTRYFDGYEDACAIYDSTSTDTIDEVIVKSYIISKNY